MCGISRNLNTYDQVSELIIKIKDKLEPFIEPDPLKRKVNNQDWTKDFDDFMKTQVLRNVNFLYNEYQKKKDRDQEQYIKDHYWDLRAL